MFVARRGKKVKRCVSRDSRVGVLRALQKPTRPAEARRAPKIEASLPMKRLRTGSAGDHEQELPTMPTHNKRYWVIEITKA
jgi:hypothetical protein